MLAEDFRTVNGKSVPFAHLRKPNGVRMKKIGWAGLRLPALSCNHM
jgi:hypothetical protein